MVKDSRKLIVIFGPTSSGKTDLSLRLAKYIYGKYHIESEMVSADSRQLYKGMDVGTSKVSDDVREKHPHHMIDIFLPTQEYSSQEFARAANKIIEDVWARGRMPMLVGGTGTYVMGLVGDRYLAASKVDSLSYDTLMLVPYFEREWLYRKVERTVEKMFQDGLYEEIKGLVRQYGAAPTQVANTHGYREFVEYAARGNKDIAQLTRADLAKIKSKIKADTKKYAMHQAGWFGKMEGYEVVKDFEQTKRLVDEFMDNGRSNKRSSFKG